MSIEKIQAYSSPDMTRVQLGKYVPAVNKEIDQLRDQFKEKRWDMLASAVTGLGMCCIAAGVGAAVAYSSGSLVLTLSLSFGPIAPFYVTSLVGIIVSGEKGVKISNELTKAETENADRSVDLQNEANRLWVKREQIRALKDNNNASQSLDQKLTVFEEKFSIRPNVSSEEEYLAYWANPQKII